MAVPGPPARPLRIALVCDWYLPRLGGIETHVGALAGQLARAGHAVDVVTTLAGGGGRAAGLVGERAPRGRPVGPPLPGRVRVRRLRVACLRPWAVALHPGVARAARRALGAGRYDLVHCHASVISPLALAAAVAAARLGLACVVTWHSVLGRGARLLAVADRLTGWARRPVLQSAVSPLVADELRRAVPGLAVHVLPNGIHPEGWTTPAPPPAGAPAGARREVRVAAVMRLAPRKRPEALLAAVARVRAALPPGGRLRVRIAGDGPERAAVARRIVRLGLGDTVELLGWLPREAVRALYASSDLFVLPSVQESFGIAALEARCAGLPVVALRRAGPAGFIGHEVEGLLADDDADLARQLLRLCVDEPLRAAIARHNRATRPAETWDVVLVRHEATYAAARRLVGIAGRVGAGGAGAPPARGVALGGAAAAGRAAATHRAPGVRFLP